MSRGVRFERCVQCLPGGIALASEPLGDRAKIRVIAEFITILCLFGERDKCFSRGLIVPLLQRHHDLWRYDGGN